MSNTSVKCVKCGYTNRTNARFCVRCGADMAAPQPVVPPVSAHASAPEFCPHCGQAITPGARFCRHCGKEMLPPAVNPTRAEPAPLPPPFQAPPSATPMHGGIPMTVPLARAGSAPTSSTAQASPPMQAAPVAEAYALSNPRLPARNTRFPGWAWALIGFLLGLLAGVGLLFVRPDLMEWMHTWQPVVIEASPTNTPLPTITPSATVAPDASITPTQTVMTPTIPATASTILTPTLSVTKTNGVTATVKAPAP